LQALAFGGGEAADARALLNVHGRFHARIGVVVDIATKWLRYLNRSDRDRR
jgi:hypothetical protein